MSKLLSALKCPCEGKYFSNWFTYDTPPCGEVTFGFSEGQSYERKIYQCTVCKHFLSIHGMDTTDLYTDDYVSSNYEDLDGLRRSFERVIGLEPSLSDNEGRILRVSKFGEENLADRSNPPTILDVGSGLCVFLHGMKKIGWNCTALDPDMRSIVHARDFVGVRAIHGDFMEAEDLGSYDAVTFNKVLEHVDDPILMLEKARGLLDEGGFVYFEVPDGEAAGEVSPLREEFFIDHPHIFSAASLTLMSSRSGFKLSKFERLKEPSGKFTLWAFLKRA